jgi:hypothetical protein
MTFLNTFIKKKDPKVSALSILKYKRVVEMIFFSRHKKTNIYSILKKYIKNSTFPNDLFVIQKLLGSEN